MGNIQAEKTVHSKRRNTHFFLNDIVMLAIIGISIDIVRHPGTMRSTNTKVIICNDQYETILL